MTRGAKKQLDIVMKTIPKHMASIRAVEVPDDVLVIKSLRDCRSHDLQSPCL